MLAEQRIVCRAVRGDLFGVSLSVSIFKMIDTFLIKLNCLVTPKGYYDCTKYFGEQITYLPILF